MVTILFVTAVIQVVMFGGIYLMRRLELTVSFGRIIFFILAFVVIYMVVAASQELNTEELIALLIVNIGLTIAGTIFFIVKDKRKKKKHKG